jgi:phosphatidylinositol-3-phosphatase
VILENEDFVYSFGPDSLAPYLAKTLPAQGALLKAYYGTGHDSNDNYISMISGQGPNILNQADCKNFVDFAGTGPIALLDGQALGQGCVFATTVPSLPDQLKAKNLSWKGYMEDMGNTPTRESATCGHPALGAQDLTQGATAADQYATRHNPFVYFHSVIDTQSYCDDHVVSLKPLAEDLASVETTPNLVFITPNLCHDGHDSPCADGEPGGLVSANLFLQQWVPLITASPAFQQDGLLIITFDESGGAVPDSTSCCGELLTPNTPLAGIDGTGGGVVGAVLLSPFIKPGTVSSHPYNHYSMLRSIEDLFGLEYLGYANALGQASFGSDIYTRTMPELPPKN